jgi:hypothetical protein
VLLSFSNTVLSRNLPDWGRGEQIECGILNAECGMGNNFRAWGLGFGVLYGNGVIAKQTKENRLKGRQKAKGDSLTTPF